MSGSAPNGSPDRRSFVAPSVHDIEHGRQVVSDVRQLSGDRQVRDHDSPQVGDQEWSQVVAQNLSEDGLAACLRVSGQSIAEYLTPDKGWLCARLL